jgi:hypothetical protein
MTEQELRALVREAIERHLGRPAGLSAAGQPAFESRHPSHLLAAVSPGGNVGDGTCLIEPVAQCCRCRHCQSYGH